MTNPSARLNLIVLRSSDKDRASVFYSKLGLQLTKHRHGKGPEHYAATLVVSSPKPLLAEWRYVIVDRQVVAGSIYMENGQRVTEVARDAKALEFANSVLKIDHQPDPVWVLDVCKTEDNQYRLLEIGCFSCAGL
ncbi:MAG: ATP-grasp domain-containing protein [Pirellulales bacterium]